MICRELREFYELYAMDALEKKYSFGASRASGPQLPGMHARRAAGRSLHESAGNFAASGVPPRKLKKRILVSLGAATPELRWLPLLATLALCAGIATAALAVKSLRQERQLTQLQQEAGMLRLPGARQVEFPGGRAVVHPDGGVLLIFPKLAPAASGRSYELWVIPKGQAPVPSGLFQASGSGATTYLRPGPLARNASAIAVSIEPASGSPAPTTKPIFVASL